jgi:hypothetical protein
MATLGDNSQPLVWVNARNNQVLRDFSVQKNTGIRFISTDNITSLSLFNLELKLFDNKVRISSFSTHSNRCFVNLVRVPGGISDFTIYDYFVQLGARPTIIMPTHAVNGLSSYQRTVYFNQNSVPKALSAPLREIIFYDDDGQPLRPCFVNHCLRKFNKTLPSSIQASREAAHKSLSPSEETSLTSSSNSQSNGEDQLSSSNDADGNNDVIMSGSNSTDSLGKDGDESMNGANTPPPQLVSANPPPTDRVFDDDSEDTDDSGEGEASESEEDVFLQQTLIFPRDTNNLPLWKRARFWMFNVTNAAPKVIDCVSSKVNDLIHEYNIETHYNRYEALWFESPQEPSIFDYDALIEDDHGNNVIHSIQPLPATSQELIVTATMDFQVETMSRQRLIEFVDAH